MPGAPELDVIQRYVERFTGKIIRWLKSFNAPEPVEHYFRRFVYQPVTYNCEKGYILNVPNASARVASGTLRAAHATEFFFIMERLHSLHEALQEAGLDDAHQPVNQAGLDILSKIKTSLGVAHNYLTIFILANTLHNKNVEYDEINNRRCLSRAESPESQTVANLGNSREEVPELVDAGKIAAIHEFFTLYKFPNSILVFGDNPSFLPTFTPLFLDTPYQATTYRNIIDNRPDLLYAIIKKIRIDDSDPVIAASLRVASMAENSAVRSGAGTADKANHNTIEDALLAGGLNPSKKRRLASVEEEEEEAADALIGLASSAPPSPAPSAASSAAPSRSASGVGGAASGGAASGGAGHAGGGRRLKKQTKKRSKKNSKKNNKKSRRSRR